MQAKNITDLYLKKETKIRADVRLQIQDIPMTEHNNYYSDGN